MPNQRPSKRRSFGLLGFFIAVALISITAHYTKITEGIGEFLMLSIATLYVVHILDASDLTRD